MGGDSGGTFGGFPKETWKKCLQEPLDDRDSRRNCLRQMVGGESGIRRPAPETGCPTFETFGTLSQCGLGGFLGRKR